MQGGDFFNQLAQLQQLVGANQSAQMQPLRCEHCQITFPDPIMYMAHMDMHKNPAIHVSTSLATHACLIFTKGNLFIRRNTKSAAYSRPPDPCSTFLSCSYHVNTRSKLSFSPFNAPAAFTFAKIEQSSSFTGETTSATIRLRSCISFKSFLQIISLKQLSAVHFCKNINNLFNRENSFCH
jgi:hypothetical protein